MLRVTKGENALFTCIFKKDNIPESLQDWTISGAVRLNAMAPALVEGTIGVANTVGGVFTVTVDTDTLQPGQYVLSIRMVKTNGPIRTVNQPLNIVQDDTW